MTDTTTEQVPGQLALTLADEGKRLSVDALSDGARAAFERVLEEWAASGRAFCSDDMREQLDLAGVPNKARGGLISGAQARGLIRHVGFVRSTHPATRGKTVSQYVGASTGPTPVSTGESTGRFEVAAEPLDHQGKRAGGDRPDGLRSLR